MRRLPLSFEEASVSTIKGRDNYGKLSTGDLLRSSFIISNGTDKSDVQMKRAFEDFPAYKGAAISGKTCMKRR